MMRLRRVLPFLILLVTFHAGNTWGLAYAAPPYPQTPDHPPLPQSEPLSSSAAPESAEPFDAPNLKAVLVVGPIDGAYGSWTTREKEFMDLAATELEQHGVAVFKFYAPNDNWSQITAAAADAHFFLYRGHGVYWSPRPRPNVGGLALSEGVISPDQIRNELRLTQNAIVMLYGCFTAGSSGGDEVAISSDEARRRVTTYADPFMDAGAAGYYANWFGDAFQMFLRYLFWGMTLGQAYEAFYDFDPTTVERYTWPDDPGLAMWLDKSYWSEKWHYDNTFIGAANKTLPDLFPIGELEITPSEITFLAEPGSQPQTFALYIGNTGPSAIPWSAAVWPDVSWLGISPPVGHTGQVATVVITPTQDAMGMHLANIRIVAEADGVQNGDRTIPVALHTLAHFHNVYLPLIVTRDG